MTDSFYAQLLCEISNLLLGKVICVGSKYPKEIQFDFDDKSTGLNKYCVKDVYNCWGEMSSVFVFKTK